tara:strand:+ start:650 stop:2095 length:1446 start_codon:yes stop_codon:yes gene_type:complete
MQKNKKFNFDYSYLSLPNQFYSITKTNTFPKPKVILLNKNLCSSINLIIKNHEDLIKLLFTKDKKIKSFSQAYAGHQFGYFTKLGDGRAVILGEHKSIDKQKVDIQVKGSGKTPYSRNGDGKATLKSMLREYLISEAIHYLNIPTSRSLAVLETGETIQRQTLEEGGILIRVMKSHIRVGTFEYASYFCSEENLKSLASYTINRLYPEINDYENPSLILLTKVMEKQIDLIINWMRVGFIHGVMNTDNTSVSGETFDYGPCAFINEFNTDTTYSSIDHNKRYSFGNQARIIKWNISRFAESLLPIIHKNKEKALQLAQDIIDSFDDLWERKYYGMMLNKIGIETNNKISYPLVDRLLHLMKKNRADYNNTFLSLTKNNLSNNELNNDFEYIRWKKEWKKNINTKTKTHIAKNLMKTNNPVIIPRNHIVENAIEEASNGNMNSFQKLLKIIKKPYGYQEKLISYMKPPSSDFEKKYKTYCGT